MDLELAEQRLGTLKDNKLTRQKVRVENIQTKKAKAKKAANTGPAAAEKFHSMV